MGSVRMCCMSMPTFLRSAPIRGGGVSSPRYGGTGPESASPVMTSNCAQCIAQVRIDPSSVPISSGAFMCPHRRSIARKLPPQLQTTSSRPFSSTAFIPPGATSAALIAWTKLSLNAHLLRRQLRQTVWVCYVPVHEQATPAALHGVEVLAVERNTWTNDLHVARAVAPDRLAGTEGHAMLDLELDLLLEQKLRELGVRREFEPHRLDDFREKVAQRLFSGFNIHLVPLLSPNSFAK